jgi:tetratricopeptide (TPR) repeat protein
MIYEKAMHEVQERTSSPKDVILFVDRISSLLDEAGYSRDLLLALREISLQAEQNANPVNRKTALVSKANLAYLYREIGRTADAIRLFRECRDESILLHGRESKVTLQCIVGLGSALRVNERGAEGAVETQKAYQEMLDIASSIFERGHPELLECEIRLAGLEYDKGNYKQAIKRYNRGIINAAFLYGEGSNEVSYIRNQLAASLWADDQAMEALKVINKNIEIIGENKAWGHDYIHAIDLKGAICYSNGDYNAAERCWLQCLASYDKTHAEDSPDKIGVLNTLGTLYHETDRFEEALHTRKRQLKMAQRLLGATDHDSLNAAINYAHVLHNDGEITRALSMLISIGMLFKASQKRDHCLYIRYLRLLGVCSRNAADYKLSEDSLKAALLASEESGNSSHVEIGQLMAGIANTLEAAEKYPECIDWRRKCLEHREGCLGARNASTSRARIELAKSYRINRQTSEALDELNKLESSIIGLTETTPAEENLLEECRALIDQIKRGGD